MMTKGKISPLLDAILSDPVESHKLRRAIATGEDYVLEIDGITYRITTSNKRLSLQEHLKKGDITGELQAT